MKRVYNLFFLFIFLSYSFKATAQRYSIDSLKIVLLTQKEDTDKVNTTCILGWRYSMEKRDFDTALIYAKQALNLANKIHYKEGIAYAYKSFGIIYSNCIKKPFNFV